MGIGGIGAGPDFHQRHDIYERLSFEDIKELIASGKLSLEDFKTILSKVQLTPAEVKACLEQIIRQHNEGTLDTEQTIYWIESLTDTAKKQLSPADFAQLLPELSDKLGKYCGERIDEIMASKLAEEEKAQQLAKLKETIDHNPYLQPGDIGKLDKKIDIQLQCVAYSITLRDIVNLVKSGKISLEEATVRLDKLLQTIQHDPLLPNDVKQALLNKITPQFQEYCKQVAADYSKQVDSIVNSGETDEKKLELLEALRKKISNSVLPKEIKDPVVQKCTNAIIFIEVLDYNIIFRQIVNWVKSGTLSLEEAAIRLDKLIQTIQKDPLLPKDIKEALLGTITPQFQDYCKQLIADYGKQIDNIINSGDTDENKLQLLEALRKKINNSLLPKEIKDPVVQKCTNAITDTQTNIDLKNILSDLDKLLKSDVPAEQKIAALNAIKARIQKLPESKQKIAMNTYNTVATVISVQKDLDDIMNSGLSPTEKLEKIKALRDRVLGYDLKVRDLILPKIETAFTDLANKLIQSAIKTGDFNVLAWLRDFIKDALPKETVALLTTKIDNAAKTIVQSMLDVIVNDPKLSRDEKIRRITALWNSMEKTIPPAFSNLALALVVDAIQNLPHLL